MGAGARAAALMRVLGIDPGSRITGFGVIELSAASGRRRTAPQTQYVVSGCVRVPSGDIAQRLQVIYAGVSEVIENYRPEVLAVEKVFLARNADSALKLGQARAAAILAAVNAGLLVTEYTALQVKQAVVGRGHAQKEQVKHMVKALLELSGMPQVDAADALACAICHAHHILGGGLPTARSRRRKPTRRKAVP